jgi:hypothetical protein
MCERLLTCYELWERSPKCNNVWGCIPINYSVRMHHYIPKYVGMHPQPRLYMGMRFALLCFAKFGDSSVNEVGTAATTASEHLPPHDHGEAPGLPATQYDTVYGNVCPQTAVFGSSLPSTIAPGNASLYTIVFGNSIRYTIVRGTAFPYPYFSIQECAPEYYGG